MCLIQQISRWFGSAIKRRERCCYLTFGFVVFGWRVTRSDEEEVRRWEQWMERSSAFEVGFKGAIKRQGLW